MNKYLLLLTLFVSSSFADTLYITLEKDNALAVVNGSNGQLIKTVPLGQRPRGLALSKDETLLYVAASDDDTIQILDLETLNIVGDLPAGEDPETFSIAAKFSEALTITKANLIDAAQNMGDPLGLRTLDATNNLEDAASDQEVSHALFGTLVKYFDGKIGAFSYLLFILLYVPCVAAIAAVKRETGTRWALFSIFWSLYLAYSMATSFYQIATFSSHPIQSLIWVGFFIAGFIGIWLILRQMGQKLLDINPANTTNA